MLRGVANASDLHLPHTCYRTDPSIFSQFCHEGDYCIDGVAYSCGLMGGVFDLDWPMILVDDFTVLLDEGVLVNETRRAQEKMSRHFAQLSNVYGLWTYLHEGRFR